MDYRSCCRDQRRGANCRVWVRTVGTRPCASAVTGDVQQSSNTRTLKISPAARAATFSIPTTPASRRLSIAAPTAISCVPANSSKPVAPNSCVASMAAWFLARTRTSTPSRTMSVATSNRYNGCRRPPTCSNGITKGSSFQKFHHRLTTQKPAVWQVRIPCTAPTTTPTHPRGRRIPGIQRIVTASITMIFNNWLRNMDGATRGSRSARPAKSWS